MIVEPDFPDHWKTQLLVNLTGQKHAPLAVIRLWAHCQQRRTARFPAYTETILASVTRWDAPGITAMDALSQSGWIDLLPEGGFEVHEWAEVNGKLVSNWRNGATGGRPPKPTGNPTATQPQPTENRPVTEKRREEERREDGEAGSVASPASPTRPPRTAKKPEPPDDDAWLATLEADPTYSGISIRTELGKLRRWCETKNRKPSRQRFINWLNRIERPMQGNDPAQPEQLSVPQPTKITLL